MTASISSDGPLNLDTARCAAVALYKVVSLLWKDITGQHTHTLYGKKVSEKCQNERVVHEIPLHPVLISSASSLVWRKSCWPDEDDLKNTNTHAN